jgi:hypothetical protein
MNPRLFAIFVMKLHLHDYMFCKPTSRMDVVFVDCMIIIKAKLGRWIDVYGVTLFFKF